MRILAMLLLTAVSFAQAPPAFDVVSVKPQPFTGSGAVGVFVRGNTLDAQHISLKDLVMFAYNLRGVQLSGGPSWAERGILNFSELFQVTAKVSADPPPPIEVFRQMLQPVLAERFQLQIHHVQKDLPIYNMVIAKGGPKLKPSPAESEFKMTISPRGKYGTRIVAAKVSVPRLVESQLGLYASRPVFDKTGLTRDYDFTLEFVGENLRPGQEDVTSEVPPLVTAVQDQLGLKLEPGTAPFDTVVIDHAERPTEN